MGGCWVLEAGGAWEGVMRGRNVHELDRSIMLMDSAWSSQKHLQASTFMLELAAIRTRVVSLSSHIGTESFDLPSKRSQIISHNGT